MASTDSMNNPGWNILFLAWLLTIASALTSIFFSAVMQLPPCVLCWYQRIFLFPLAFIFTTGLFFCDKSVVRYALPLAGAGWLVALYQNLLVYGIVPESIKPCSQGVSCTESYFDLLGFLTIPVLSFMAFTIILVLLYTFNRRISQ
ncbi:disulfide bond formation protein B [Desulfonatronum sp. SC1]|uniref:disulfide bond formation protein B n=1 Tax=Desulfonatronum sp. SC1 TaxID=2109626 RepID=UPI000D2FF433|nr:disulfide bond formation protein B [Desulfonatronum sp. SC1]PTN32372.1 disulfide bond formation protein B [Desulfonatronum sp. SC1]